jgi:CheY-like chemotaxis protein
MPQVLVVEDSATQAKAIALMLTAAGFDVLSASDGVEAMAVMGRSKPDLVLTDLQMPRMNGLEVVEAVREKYPLVPTVLMTAQGSEEIAFQALQKGAASYVPKHNIEQGLIDTLNSVLAMALAGRSHQRLASCMVHNEVQFMLDNDCTLVPPLVDHVRRTFVDLLDCDDTDGIRIGVALEEALLDALYTGNLEVAHEMAVTDPQGYQRTVDERLNKAPWRDRRIRVDAVATRDQAVCRIRHDGPGFAAQLPADSPATALDDLTCRSRLLMRTFMDEVFYNEAGNEITLVKRRGRTISPGKGV